MSCNIMINSPDGVLIIDPGLEAGEPEAHAEAGVVGVHEAVVVDAAVVAEPHGDAHLGLRLGDVLEDVDWLCNDDFYDILKLQHTHFNYLSCSSRCVWACSTSLPEPGSQDDCRERDSSAFSARNH